MSTRQGSTIELTPVPYDETLFVPITSDSRRGFHLMKDDYIRVKWNDSVAHTFGVGSLAHDELFGDFYVTEEQFPTLDQNTGAYVHDIRFDREYIGWKNLLYMLTYTENFVISRRETQWTLTDTLANHMGEFMRNLQVLGYDDYVYSIDSNYVDTNTAISVSFSGTSLFDALTAYANAWQCEWWVTYEEYGTAIIHFGKCITTDEEIGLTVGDNVESMTAQESERDYANKVYAYGSTKNIPDTYRKDLVFTVTDAGNQDDGESESNTKYLCRDNNRKITVEMLNDPVNRTVDLTLPNAGIYQPYSDECIATLTKTFQIDRDGWYSFTADVLHEVGLRIVERNATFYELDAALKIDGETLWSDSVEKVYNDRFVFLQVTFPQKRFFEEGTHTLTVEYNFHEETRSRQSTGTISYVVKEENTAYMDCIGTYIECTLTYNNNQYTVHFNPFSKEYSQTTFNWFAFAGNVPSGFGVGSKYTLNFSDGTTNGLLQTKVPSSYYTDELGAPGSLRLLGERRLMLPKVHNGTQIPGYLPVNPPAKHLLVEKVVIFEEDYPKCALRITDVQVGTYNADTQYADGSKTLGSLPKYTIKAVRITPSGTEAFNFKNEYLTPEPLQIKFLTRDEEAQYGTASSTPHSLSGMTFGVNFDELGQAYTIVWNSDYGAMLPNNVLRPVVGDSFILIGWNTKAMESLGLIDTAEQKLYADTEAWLQAANEPQFTFQANMMSDYMSERDPFAPGQPVLVNHGSLRSPMHTRIIGFDLHLDYPYDSPTYEAGESEAYSRLREIEKSLNAQSQNVTATSGTVSSSSNGGGLSSGTTSNALAWETGSMEGVVGGSFDGSAAKTITIPSTFAHLASHPASLSGYGITDAVNTTGAQEVGGAKTFTSPLTASGGLTVESGMAVTGNSTVAGHFQPSIDGTYSLGYSDRRWSAINAQSVGAANLYLAKNDTTGTNCAILTAAEASQTERYLSVRVGQKGYMLYETAGFFYNNASGVSNVDLGKGDHRWANIYADRIYLDNNSTYLYKDVNGNWHIKSASGGSVNLIVDGDIACG